MANKKNTKKDMNKKVQTKQVNVQKKSEQFEEVRNEIQNLLIIITCIVGIIIILYFITEFVTNKKQLLKYSKVDAVSQISYTDIMASDILRKEGSYYVLVEDENDSYMELYKTYITSYLDIEGHLPVYFVDLNDSLNQKYMAEENDFSSQNLKFKGTVLLKIVDGRVENHYQDSASISEHLKTLVAK